jgi:hypothetical protein
MRTGSAARTGVKVSRNPVKKTVLKAIASFL